MSHKLRGLAWDHYATRIWTGYASHEMPLELDDCFFYNSFRGVI